MQCPPAPGPGKNGMYPYGFVAAASMTHITSRRSTRHAAANSLTSAMFTARNVFSSSLVISFFFSSRRRHTSSVSAFLLNRSSDLLAYQQKESTARVASIMENTNLSKQQQVSEIMRQMLTQAQTAGQYFTNDQIKEMTRKVSAEVDLVHQQTQNQRYGSSH